MRFARGGGGVVATLRADGVGAADVPALLLDLFSRLWVHRRCASVSLLQVGMPLFTYMVEDGGIGHAFRVVIVDARLAVPDFPSMVRCSRLSTRIKQEMVNEQDEADVPCPRALSQSRKGSRRDGRSSLRHGKPLQNNGARLGRMHSACDSTHR